MALVLGKGCNATDEFLRPALRGFPPDPNSTLSFLGRRTHDLTAMDGGNAGIAGALKPKRRLDLETGEKPEIYHTYSEAP